MEGEKKELQQRRNSETAGKEFGNSRERGKEKRKKVGEGEKGGILYLGYKNKAGAAPSIHKEYPGNRK